MGLGGEESARTGFFHETEVGEQGQRGADLRFGNGGNQATCQLSRNGAAFGKLQHGADRHGPPTREVLQLLVFQGTACHIPQGHRLLEDVALGFCGSFARIRDEEEIVLGGASGKSQEFQRPTLAPGGKVAFAMQDAEDVAGKQSEGFGHHPVRIEGRLAFPLFVGVLEVDPVIEIFEDRLHPGSILSLRADGSSVHSEGPGKSGSTLD